MEYGEAGSPRYLLVDGGPAQTYAQHLSQALTRLKQGSHNLELVVLSHVDTDHVTGLLDFFADLRTGDAATLPSVAALWHNSFSRTIDVKGTLYPRLEAVMAAATGAPAMVQSAIAINGIGEGNQLRTQALVLGIPLNPGFANQLIMAPANALWRSNNLELTVVGPTQTNLDSLRMEWDDWLTNHQAAVQSGDPYVMANSDRSIPNLSSIQLLAKADGKSMLLTGDGRSDHLLQGLTQAGMLDGAGKLHVDILKLPHHGSDRNVSRTFFKKVTADVYVASADGTNANPDLATLIWVVEAAKEANRKIRLVCTNTTKSTQKLQQDYSAAEYGYNLEIMRNGEHELRIELA